MAKKNIIFESDVREKISRGIKKLADAVKVTLGPTGRVVMIEREYGDPYVTKDGVTVAKEVELPDPIENMGAQIVKQATSKTSSVAGDGTTTATIYAEAIYNAGLKSIANGAKSQEVKRGIDKAVAVIVSELGKMAKPVVNQSQMIQIAICSANQDKEVGNIVAAAIEKVGRDGVVTIEEGRTIETGIEVVDGLQIDRGFLSGNFATNKEAMVAEYENPLILLTDMRISTVKPILKFLENIARSTRPLLIIAEDVDGEALATFIVNNLRGAIKCVAVKAPSFGDRRLEILEDIAVVTGATVLSREHGHSLENIDIDMLGTCKKVTVTQDTTTIVEGGPTGNNPQIEAIKARISIGVEERIAQLKNRLASVSNDFDREKLQERLAKLVGGVARIIVGGATEAEMRERKDRIDDALHACKAAADEGILPGGGIAALHARRKLKQLTGLVGDESIGVGIVSRAVEAPLRQIAKNTGIDDGAVLARIYNQKKVTFGFNAASGKYGDMLSFGVIVPAKVERVALQNAASVAGLLLTADCMISIIQEPRAQDGGTFPSLG